ncbi:hypothetical protein ACLKA7_009799 [Drosophila subpalustris]
MTTPSSRVLNSTQLGKYVGKNTAEEQATHLYVYTSNGTVHRLELGVKNKPSTRFDETRPPTVSMPFNSY